jgi:hypothetical protein
MTRRKTKPNKSPHPKPTFRPISSTGVPLAARLSFFGLVTVILFDSTIIDWLFYDPPNYHEPLQTLAIYGVPFLMLGMLFHTQLFYWHNEITRYYERVYFILKALLTLPGIVMSFAVSYRSLGLIDENQVTTNPSTCLYFSIVTWTTLGYGDVRPSPKARMLAALEAVAGYVVMAVFIGLFATLFHYILAKRLPGKSGLVRESEDIHGKEPS